MWDMNAYFSVLFQDSDPPSDCEIQTINYTDFGPITVKEMSGCWENV